MCDSFVISADILDVEETKRLAYEDDGCIKRFFIRCDRNDYRGKGYQVDFEQIICMTQLERQLNDKGDQILNINNLSGGERSRISLAQNLIRNPELILIDESLSSVDEAMEAEIISTIISEFKNSTIICISHRKRSAEYFDRVIKF